MNHTFPHLTVQCFVLLGPHQLRCVPRIAANTLQPIQVLFVLDLKRDSFSLNLSAHFFYMPFCLLWAST